MRVLCEIPLAPTASETPDATLPISLNKRTVAYRLHEHSEDVVA